MRQIAVWVGLVCLVCVQVQADEIEARTYYSFAGGADIDEAALTSNTLGAPIVSGLTEFGLYGSATPRAMATLDLGGMTGAVLADGFFFGGPLDNIVRAVDTLSLDITNPGAYSFAFAIPESYIEISDAAGIGPMNPGAPAARYEVRVSVNGLVRWLSAARIQGGQLGAVFERTGVELNETYYTDGGSVQGYTFDAFGTSVDLGILQAGDVVSYMLWTEVTSWGFELGGVAAIGDPNQLLFSSGQLIRSGGPGNPIPEPNSLLLLAAGVGLLAWLKRRR